MEFLWSSKNSIIPKSPIFSFPNLYQCCYHIIVRLGKPVLNFANMMNWIILLLLCKAVYTHCILKLAFVGKDITELIISYTFIITLHPFCLSFTFVDNTVLNRQTYLFNDISSWCLFIKSSFRVCFTVAGFY